MKTAYLNPFGQDALEIIQGYGNITKITETTQEINNIIEHTPNQDIKKVNTIRELCYEKIRYHYQHQFNPKRRRKEYNYLFTQEIENADTIATHTLLQTIAVNYGSDTYEADQITQLITNTTRERIEKNNDEEILDQTLKDYIDINNTTLTDILPLVKECSLRLHKIILNNNEVILTYPNFLDHYSKNLKHRRPETTYNLLCHNTKKDILTALIQKQTTNYIKQIESQLKQIEPAPLIKTLSQDIKKIETQQKQKIIQKHAKNRIYTSFNDDQPTPYIPEAFPPCIQQALQGSKQGGRNYTISLLLTPFLSYARLYPGVYAKHIKNPNIKDMDPTLNITQQEILPLIHKAAQNCKPPLLTDQPEEIQNIHNKLGFGEGEITTNNAGKTPWYTPPNCKNIKQQQPQLCTPCQDCQKIGNPLSYYNRKRKLLTKKKMR